MMHIAQGFMQQAQSYPEKLAVLLRTDLQHTTGYSYGELLDSAQQIARRIADLGKPLDKVNHDKAEHSDRSLFNSASTSSLSPFTASLHNAVQVGLLLPNGIDFLQVFLGVTIGGGVAIVLDPKWTPHQIHQVLQKCSLDLLFVDAALLPNLVLPTDLQVVAVDSVLAHSVLAHPVLTQVSKAQTLLNQTSLSGQTRLLDYAQWLNSSPLSQPSIRPIAATDAFYVGFTSGTTGQAKGVVRSHRSWVSSFIASQIEFGTNATDRILVPGALVHSLSLYAVLEGLNAGATVYLLTQFSPKTVLHCLKTDAITMLVAVPTWLGTIAKAMTNHHQPSSSPAYTSLRAVIAGGAKLEPDLRATLSCVFLNADILEYFGALELSFIALASSRESVPPQSVGRSFAGVTISVRRQNGTGEADIGEVGWIGVQSPMLSAGYLHSSDLHGSDLSSSDGTGYRIIDGWATVGDLGWQDADGYLYLTGREQEMLISGGINIYPAEIESVLRSFPEIDKVAVFGIPDADRGQAIVAAIRWTESSCLTQPPLTRSELLQRLQTLLPRTKCPRYFFTVDRFPMTSSGKVMRTALREQFLAQLQQPRSKLSLYIL